MKKIVLVLTSFIFASLVGCATKQFGYSQEEWNSLSSTQQEQAKKDYLRQKQAQTDGYVMSQNQAKEALAKHLSGYQDHNSRITHHASGPRSYNGHGYKQESNQASEAPAEQAPLITGDILNVTIEGGRVNFYGKHRSYEPISFRIKRDEQKQITLRRTDHDSTTKAWVNYYNGSFSFDVGKNEFHRDEGRVFAFLPSWRSGATYQVRTGKRSDLEARDISLTINAVKLNE